MIIPNAFYIIDDSFFIRFENCGLKFNKDEHRPHYYCVKDKNTELYWVIPLSSKINKYKAIIKNYEDNNKRCDKLHIIKLDNGIESVFLIQDIFPVTEKYIKRPYTINKNHLKLTSESQIKIIHKKATKIIGMIKRNVRFFTSQPNSYYIQNELLKDKNVI